MEWVSEEDRLPVNNQRDAEDAERPVERIVRFQIVLGHYTISAYDNDSLWLENEAGEGMQVWNNDVGELLHNFFTENF